MNLIRIIRLSGGKLLFCIRSTKLHCLSRGNLAENISMHLSILQPKEGSDKLQDEIHNGSSKDIGVESVQESAMARNQISRIFQASIPLHHALYEVSAQAGQEDEQS